MTEIEKLSGTLLIRGTFCYLLRSGTDGRPSEALLFIDTLPTGASLLDGFRAAPTYFAQILGKASGENVVLYGSYHSHEHPPVICVRDHRLLDTDTTPENRIA